MAELSQHIEIKPGSERSFGIVFSVVFAIIALFPLLGGGMVRWPVAVISAAFFLVAFLWPKFFAVPNRLWFRLGMLLGSVISPIVMALIYIVAVIPTGVAIRLMGKDPLRSSVDKRTSSYWTSRKSPMQPMTDQF